MLGLRRKRTNLHEKYDYPFLQHHGELLDPDHWNSHKQRILAGTMLDVFPYEAQRRFVNRRGASGMI